MVLNDRSNVEVVFMVEGTANLSLYAESIKSSYIIPTLEILSGGPADDSDYEFENSLNCSLFALVVFLTADSAPDPASFCYGPTSSTHKLLQWFDKIQFHCGGASTCSQITEGAATALQCFDEFKTMRENASPGSSLNKIPKHCILICNSPPYGLPAAESITYNGIMIDRLVGIMGERGISLSVFSPRKMPFLFKLYEKAGGDLASALSKNYAKDRRHLILLKNFQLQERPISPQTTQSSNKSLEKASPSPSPSNQGQKRPLSPASSAVYSKDSVQITIHQQQPQQLQQQVQQNQLQQQHIRGPPPPPPTFVQPDKAPVPDSMIRPGQNPMPVLTSQLSSIRQGAPTVVAQQPVQPGQPNQARMGFPGAQIRPVQREGYNSVMITGQLRGASSPFSAPPPSPMNRASVPSPLSQNSPSPMPVPPGGMMNQDSNVVTNQQMIPAGQQMIPPGQQMQPIQPMQSNMIKEPKIIWSGTMEYQDKKNSDGMLQKFPLPCTISTANPNTDLEKIAEKWRPSLHFTIIHRNLLNTVTNLLKNESYVVFLNFANQETSEVVQKLQKTISGANRQPPGTQWCGCVTLSPNPTTMMIVIYSPDKNMFMGFLPMNQDAFLHHMRNAYTHQKNKVPQQPNQQQQPQANIGQPMMGQPMGQPQQPQMIQQMPGNQQPGQMAALQAQPQQAPQHTLQPQNQQLGQQIGFRNQPVQGIRMNSGPTNHGMINQPMPNQMIAPSGQRPPQQTNVLLNQALGPIQGSGGHPQFTQNQMIGGQQQTTATLVTQGGPPVHQQPQQQQQQQQQPQQPQQSQQIHFNSQNVSGPTLANLMQHTQQATQQQQVNSQPPPPQQPQQQQQQLSHDVRRSNLMNIQQLQKQLEAAKQTELEFAAQHQHTIDHTIPSGHTFFDQSTGIHYSKSSSGELGTNFRPISASPRTGPDPETDLNLSKGHLLRPEEMAFSQTGTNLQGKPPDNVQAHPQHQQPLVRQQLQQHIQQMRLQQMQQPVGVKSAPGLRNLLLPQQHQVQQQQIRTNMQPGPNQQQQWRFNRT